MLVPIITILVLLLKVTLMEHNVNYSDYFVKDASFIKLDNVVLGYTFDKTLLKAASLRFTARSSKCFCTYKIRWFRS